MIALYHTKNYQGTTTYNTLACVGNLLYHTKNYQGTTTVATTVLKTDVLYHTKNYQGTTTLWYCAVEMHSIIPYQELPGNYNLRMVS